MNTKVEWREPDPDPQLTARQKRWAEWQSIADDIMSRPGEWASIGPWPTSFLERKSIHGQIFGDKTKWEVTTRAIEGSKKRDTFIRYIGEPIL